MTNITVLNKRKTYPDVELLAVELYALINNPQFNNLPLSTIVGILEMVKADVLDSMKGEG